MTKPTVPPVIAIIGRCEAYTLYADDRPITTSIPGLDQETDYYATLGRDDRGVCWSGVRCRKTGRRTMERCCRTCRRRTHGAVLCKGHRDACAGRGGAPIPREECS